MHHGAIACPPAGEIILTYDDYAEIPNDGKRYEIIEGDLFVTPAPIPKHQKTIVHLCSILSRYLEDHPIGEVYIAPIDLILTHTNVVQPDLLYLSAKKRHLVSRRGIEGPPDLIIEVLSPTTEKTDRTTKSRLYARFGVTHYWLIDPTKEQIERFHLSGRRYRALPLLKGSAAVRFDDLFPGLSFRPSDLWV